MYDPLDLLREYWISNKPMHHDEHHIFIGELKFPRQTMTTYKQDRGRGDTYPLEAMYFLLQRQHLAGAANATAYDKESRQAGFTKVLLADHKDVIAYLTGKAETSSYLISIDELAAPVPLREKRPREEREEPKLDIGNKEQLEAKRHLSTRLSQRSLLERGGSEKRSIAVEPAQYEASSEAYISVCSPVQTEMIDGEVFEPQGGSGLGLVIVATLGSEC